MPLEYLLLNLNLNLLLLNWNLYDFHEMMLMVEVELTGKCQAKQETPEKHKKKISIKNSITNK